MDCRTLLHLAGRNIGRSHVRGLAAGAALLALPLAGMAQQAGWQGQQDGRQRVVTQQDIDRHTYGEYYTDRTDMPRGEQFRWGQPGDEWRRGQDITYRDYHEVMYGDGPAYRTDTGHQAYYTDRTDIRGDHWGAQDVRYSEPVRRDDWGRQDARVRDGRGQRPFVSYGDVNFEPNLGYGEFTYYTDPPNGRYLYPGSTWLPQEDARFRQAQLGAQQQPVLYGRDDLDRPIYSRDYFPSGLQRDHHVTGYSDQFHYTGADQWGMRQQPAGLYAQQQQGFLYDDVRFQQRFGPGGQVMGVRQDFQPGVTGVRYDPYIGDGMMRQQQLQQQQWRQQQMMQQQRDMQMRQDFDRRQFETQDRDLWRDQDVRLDRRDQDRPFVSYGDVNFEPNLGYGEFTYYTDEPNGRYRYPGSTWLDQHPDFATGQAGLRQDPRLMQTRIEGPGIHMTTQGARGQQTDFTRWYDQQR